MISITEVYRPITHIRLASNMLKVDDSNLIPPHLWQKQFWQHKSHSVFHPTFMICILKYWFKMPCPLRWGHRGRDGDSNHQPHDCLLNRLFGCRSKKTSKLRVTGLCVGNSPVTGEFPEQMASNAENISIWWRHHVLRQYHKWHPALRDVINHSVSFN